MSRDAIGVATLFGSIFLIRIYLPIITESMAEFLTYCLAFAWGDPDALSKGLALQFIAIAARTTGPLLLATIFLTVTATFIQTRMLVATEIIKPKFSNISPLSGFKRLFSLRSVVEALKNLLKMLLLLWLIYSCLRDMLLGFPAPCGGGSALGRYKCRKCIEIFLDTEHQED